MQKNSAEAVLILAGNTFAPTFLGACFAANSVLGPIAAVHIFDTAESSASSIQMQREQEIRRLLGPIDVTTTLVEDSNLQTRIPERISHLIRMHGLDQLIVDLSNGQKVTASVLYAVSTISRIPNIYALEFSAKPTTESRVWEMKQGVDWHYVQIHPLREILNITQSSYVELIYYRDRIDRIMSLLREKNEDFAANVHDRLEHSLVDYFAATTAPGSERLERCVNGLGKVCEDIAWEWYESGSQAGLLKGRALTFNDKIKQIVSAWDKQRSDASRDQIDVGDPFVSGAILPTLVCDTFLETMRVYRNLASHNKRHYELRKEDARLALDLSLLLLERLSDSTILMPRRGDRSEAHD